MADLSDVYAYLAIFGVFFYMLRQLLKFAQKNMQREYPGIKDDDFYRSCGYSFDYVLVFKVCGEDEDYEKFNEFQQDFTFGKVLDRLQAAGLETKQFFSCQRDEVYIKVRAKPERLRAEASRINYRLQLDPDRVRAKCNVGKKTGKKYVWKPIKFIDEFKQSSINPYEYIFAAYDADANREGLFKTYECNNGFRHIFRPVDRINLLISIMQAKTGEQQGAGLNINKMVARTAVLAAFPLHDYDMLKRVQQNWLNLCGAPWTQPLDEVKDYFGERIGLYFLYLQHYVTFLMPIAFVGAITYIAQKVISATEYVFMPIFSTFVMLWTTWFFVAWRRTEKDAAMRWGTHGIEGEEQDSPLFDGTLSKSPIDGKPFFYFPDEVKQSRERNVASLIITMIITVVAIVVGIYYFQFWISRPARDQLFILMGINLASIIGSLLNSVVIVSLNMIYQGIAIRLNDFENHRTDTEYEDYLISKIFLFQMVNSFAGLTYVSFVKSFLNIKCISETCTGDVANALSTIFLSALISRAIIEIFVRKLTQESKFKKETGGLPPGVFPGVVEEQYILAQYHVITGTLTDYAGLVVQFGYVVLFVSAFPLAPTIAFVSAFIQIRIDGWKLCQAYRRVQPRIAEDIGIWEDFLRLLGYVSVLYNYGLIFFTGQYLIDTTWEFRWIGLILVEHTLIMLKFYLEESVPEMAAETEIQLARQEFLVDKVVRNQKDDDDDDLLEDGKANANFRIFDRDEDWDQNEKGEWGLSSYGEGEGLLGDEEKKA